MNERIRELAEQAFFDEATSQSSDKMYTFSDHKMQQFAELIAQECVDVCRTGVTASDFELANSAANRILRHFGIEG